MEPLQLIVVIGSIIISIVAIDKMEDDCEEQQRTEEHAKENSKNADRN